MNVVILGNGILALTTAYRVLQRLGPSDRITIVGPSDRPGSATLAAAAMLNSYADLEAGALDSPPAQLRFALSREATTAWPRFVADLLEQAAPTPCLQCGGSCRAYHSVGTYLLDTSSTDGGTRNNFDAVTRALIDFAEPFTSVSPTEIPGYQPEALHQARRAVFLPCEGWLNPRVVVAAIEEVLGRDRRIRFVEGTASRLRCRAGRVAALQLGDETDLEGDVFLSAIGASTTRLLQHSDLRLAIQPVFYGTGTTVQVELADAQTRFCIRTTARGALPGVYTAPYPGGPNGQHNQALLGATSRVQVQPDLEASEDEVAYVRRAAARYVRETFGSAAVMRVNLGWRPVSLDTFPLVGRTSIPNLIVATGTRRDGLHLSPLISRLLAALMLGEPADERWSCFSPERPLIRSLTRAEAIERALQAAQEAGDSDVPRSLRHPLLQLPAAALRDSLERLHDVAGASDWGIPLEMLPVYAHSTHSTASQFR